MGLGRIRKESLVLFVGLPSRVGNRGALGKYQPLETLPGRCTAGGPCLPRTVAGVYVSAEMMSIDVGTLVCGDIMP